MESISEDDVNVIGKKNTWFTQYRTRPQQMVPSAHEVKLGGVWH